MKDAIWQHLPPQFQSPWEEWHKEDGAGPWEVLLDMYIRPPKTTMVALHIPPQINPYVLWWAANLVATPPQKFSAGSPAKVKARKIPAEQVARVLEASIQLICEEDMVRQNFPRLVL